MVRNVDHESRRRQILTATILKYIKDAEPVASCDLTKEFDLSSATIRNIFSELEELGYLTHPYTSGGRIPTDKGYRYYIDFLISQMELEFEEKLRIEEELNKGTEKLEDLLEETSEILSEITHNTGIVSFLEWQDRFFYRGISYILDEPEFRSVEKMRLLIRALEERKNLLSLINQEIKEKVKVFIGKDLESLGIEDCALVVTSYGLADTARGRIAVLGPKRMRYQQVIPAIKYISEALTNALGRF
ncbi:MAG: DeoR family transcriptional regulator [Candidatus Omnitrophica bacterium]|nr:DeoR family transcriptional regulator [Candidatus Omnitrophota bacterium]